MNRPCGWTTDLSDSSWARDFQSLSLGSTVASSRVHGMSGSFLPPSRSRKRKWNSANVTRIDFGDHDSDFEDVSTAVIHQVTRDGRRIERTFHSIPMPRDPQTVVEPYNFALPDDMDFEMDVVDGTLPDKADDVNVTVCVWFAINGLR